MESASIHRSRDDDLATTAARGYAVEVHHPKPAMYLGIFVLLFIFTALEVGVTYVPSLPQLPLLLGLALIKGATIVLFYMHLRFDSRAFAALFLAGLTIAVSMIITLMGLFLAHSRVPFDQAAAQEQAQSKPGTTTTSAGEKR